MKQRRFNRHAVKLLLLIILIPLLIISTGVIGYRTLYRAVRHEAVGTRPLQRADAVAVFGAAVNGAGYPTKVLLSRLDKALHLHKEGLAPRFILTGGVGWNPPAESVAMRRYLAAKGVPFEVMDIETRSKSTLEQVRFIKKTAAANGWKQIIAVSDPLHLYRIRCYFSGSGLQLQTVPAYRLRNSDKKQHAFIQMEILKLLSWYLFGR